MSTEASFLKKGLVTSFLAVTVDGSFQVPLLMQEPGDEMSPLTRVLSWLCLEEKSAV